MSASPELIDTHVHLTLEELGEAPDAYWDAARAAGVVQAVVVGIDADSSEGVVDFVGCRPGLFAAVGIHPNESGSATDEDLERIRRLAEHPAVAAIGEAGIDLYWKRAPLDTQERWLARQAELALELRKPLVLHLRDAFPEACRTLEPFAARGLSAVVHCFTGGAEDLQPFLEWGFFISFSGILTYPGAGRLREAAAEVPPDRALVETDAPWLTPHPHRGRTNEPALVVHTAKALAGAWGRSFEETARLTTANARRVFQLG